MSRRMRLKPLRQAQKIGLSHHTNYSSSTTYFPQSYSIFGTPITLTNRTMSLAQNQKINFKCTEQELIDDKCPLFHLDNVALNQATIVNLTVEGKISQKNNIIITILLFIFSIIMCCLFAVFSNSSFRRKFFTRYHTKTKVYQKLALFISKLHNCQTLIINIQDNQLNEIKMQILQKGIFAGMGSTALQSHQANSSKMKKHVIIRNYCYFMGDMSTDKIIEKLEENYNIESTFIWQTKVINTKHSQKLNDDNRTCETHFLLKDDIC